MTLDALEKIAEALDWDPWQLFNMDRTPISLGLYQLLVAEVQGMKGRMEQIERWLHALDPSRWRSDTLLLYPMGSSRRRTGGGGGGGGRGGPGGSGAGGGTGGKGGSPSQDGADSTDFPVGSDMPTGDDFPPGVFPPGGDFPTDHGLPPDLMQPFLDSDPWSRAHFGLGVIVPSQTVQGMPPTFPKFLPFRLSPPPPLMPVATLPPPLLTPTIRARPWPKRRPSKLPE